METKDSKNKPTAKSSFRTFILEMFSSPKKRDHLVVTPTAWIGLFVLIVCLVSAMGWAFLGSIPITINGRGIVVNEKGLLYTVESRTNGNVSKIAVKNGDFVKKGQVLVETADPQEELKLKTALVREAKIKTELDALKKEIDSETKIRTDALKADLAIKKHALDKATRATELLQKGLFIKQELLAKGLVKSEAIDESREQLAAKNLELVTTQAAIVQINAELAKGYRTDELSAKEKELAQATESREILEANHVNYAILSPNQGNILEVLVSDGEQVVPGNSVVWMEYADQTDTGRYLIKGYFPVEKGKNILPLMQVRLDISTVDAKEYGYLLATVKEVSPFAVSRDSIAKSIHNKELVSYLTEGYHAVIQVTVQPDADPKNPMQYLWSSGKVPPTKITTGTMCHMEAVVGYVRPIYYVIPLSRFKN